MKDLPYKLKNNGEGFSIHFYLLAIDPDSNESEGKKERFIVASETISGR